MGEGLGCGGEAYESQEMLLSRMSAVLKASLSLLHFAFTVNTHKHMLFVGSLMQVKLNVLVKRSLRTNRFSRINIIKELFRRETEPLLEVQESLTKLSFVSLTQP